MQPLDSDRQSIRSRITKYFAAVAIIILLSFMVGIYHRDEIRVAYHRDRLFAALEMLSLVQNPRPTKSQGLRILLFQMSETKASEAMQKHEAALLRLGYLMKQEFALTNRTLPGTNGNWAALQQQVTNIFDSSHWWSVHFPASNRLAVTATSADMPGWAKTISDFDQPSH